MNPDQYPCPFGNVKELARKKFTFPPYLSINIDKLSDIFIQD